jgi:predicted ABC-type ATPase
MHMTDPALQILDLDDSALGILHESLHKSQDAPTIELHHLVTTEMLKRGLTHGHIDDFWTKAIIETSYIQDADLNSLGNGYSTDFVKAIKESTGSDTADVRIVLTVDGYEMRIEPIEKRELSARVESALEAKVTEHNSEVDDDSKTTSLATLREVFRRGVGAYQTNPSSVRPNVTNPDQWAMGRVNAYLYALRNGKFRSGKFDTDLLPEGHPMSTKGNVEKMIREEDGKFTVYNEAGTRRFGTYDSKEEAKRRLSQIEQFSKSKTYTPPQGVREAARRALDWIEEGKAGSGFTSVGRRRAQQLAAGEKISRDTVMRMKSFLARHAVDRKAQGFNRGEKGYPSAGRVAWDAWGGDEARTWVNGLLGDMEKAYDPKEGLNDRQLEMYRDYENQVAVHGVFNQSADADGAHYFGKESNPFAGEGMNCSNCVFYLGGGGCEIVEGQIDPMGLCKLWIIPESLIEKATEPFSDTEFIEKHREGQHDQKTHGAWADGIADEINAGKQPTIESENLTAFLGKAALRDDHPDITELHIDGSPLFGEEGLGIARKDMPQVPAERREEFLADIARDKGVQVTAEDVDPRTLQPIQKEVSAARAGAIFRKFADQERIPEGQRILISKDGYVVDGHHTWAASVGLAFDHDSKLPVYRLSVNAREALDAALEWSNAQGIEGQAIDAKKARYLEAFAKHGDHDQSSHGNWSTSQRRERLLSDGNFRQPDLLRTGQGQVINPDATGGYKANIPEVIEYRGQVLTPSDSAWHHMESDGAGGYRFTAERDKVHTQIIRDAVEGVTPSADPSFYLLGGGPASGKSTVVASGQTGIPVDNAVLINADDVKAALPENARMRTSNKDADFFNAAAFTHEESSMVAKSMQRVAQRQQKDIILDGTGDSKIEKLTAKVNEAVQAGYKVKATYVTIPTEEAWNRSKARAIDSNRFVPEYVVRETHAEISRVFPRAMERGIFAEVKVYENSGSSPVLIAQGVGRNLQIIEPQLWTDFLEKGR